MKNIRFGNILSVKEGIIIHGCNSFQVFGSGIALQIKDQYPDCFLLYRDGLLNLKRAGIDPLGKTFPFVASDKFHILNAITQRNFGRDSGKRYVDYSAIQQVFHFAAAYAAENNMHIHYPQIGAGLGAGDWALISEIIDTELALTDRTLWIYES